eukprot:644987-Pleurochrysis_carterae.AAC.1
MHFGQPPERRMVDVKVDVKHARPTFAEVARRPIERVFVRDSFNSGVRHSLAVSTCLAAA